MKENSGNPETEQPKLTYSLKRNSTNIRPTTIKKNGLINFQNNGEIHEYNSSTTKKENSKLLKFWYKIKKNLVLAITLIFILYIYYVYLFLYIVPILYSSKKGLDYRFWYCLKDGKYRTGFSYFFIFHLLLIFMFYSMSVSMLTDPGKLDPEYLKYFDLLKNIDKNQISDVRMRIYLNNLLKRKEENDEIEGEILESAENNNNAISMDSFQQLFNQELSFEMNEYEDIYNDDPTNSSKRKYFSSKEFFFKFLYYTIDINFEKVKSNKYYCVFCKIIRPERTHHCKECKKCVLKMDHHCGILNTCVGFYNYRPWMVFVFYSTITLLFLIVTMLDGISFYLDNNNFGLSTIECKVFLFTLIILLIGFGSVGELFITHLLYVAKGVTTIEDKSKSMMDQLINHANVNKGFLESMKEIFGNNACGWMLPTNKKFTIYDGYIWRYNRETYYEYINERRSDYLKIIGSEGQNVDNSENQDSSFISANESLKLPV